MGHAEPTPPRVCELQFGWWSLAAVEGLEAGTRAQRVALHCVVDALAESHVAYGVGEVGKAIDQSVDCLSGGAAAGRQAVATPRDRVPAAQQRHAVDDPPRRSSVGGRQELPCGRGAKARRGSR